MYGGARPRLIEHPSVKKQAKASSRNSEVWPSSSSCRDRRARAAPAAATKRQQSLIHNRYRATLRSSAQLPNSRLALAPPGLCCDAAFALTSFAPCTMSNAAPEEVNNTAPSTAAEESSVSALRDNIATKGKNAYYYAHSHRADGPAWDGKPGEPGLDFSLAHYNCRVFVR